VQFLSFSRELLLFLSLFSLLSSSFSINIVFSPLFIVFLKTKTNKKSKTRPPVRRAATEDGEERETLTSTQLKIIISKLQHQTSLQSPQ